MNQYEYLYREAKDYNVQEILNEMGLACWELVSTCATHTNILLFFKKVKVNQLLLKITNNKPTALWCNGSITDFDSVRLGSNPNGASKF